ncbi:MAG: PPOX class F420-dependent oxidoreductase [SAR202 cluster bacterium]|jgi:PPOX class probable F420-dependent enzyme|nr:PPOX class F420-dependent oxidoreductase [SAR202 cluster bacterium]MDP6513196.1 PPOX class F420-dependent oxidoreductase [SAR202 cluster bacterium]|tara:strand:- start:501 stop:923 length:423 start_codon:yes stop_codon:yes gene_type:complete
MLSDNTKSFLSENHQAVLTTFRRDGGAQMSIVTVGGYRDGAAFTTTEGRAKLMNLRRNPRCSLLVSQDNWRSYVVLEGQAQVLAADTTDAEELKHAFRDVYRAASGGKEHPDWDDYDRVMVEDKRAAIVVVPDRVYGATI